MIKPKLKIILAQPRGFCAGVDRAIEIVERSLLKFGAPVYVRHEIVHNKYVLEDLRKKGAIFVRELDEVPTPVQTLMASKKDKNNSNDVARLRGKRFIKATEGESTHEFSEALIKQFT